MSIERTGSSEDYAEMVSNAAHEAAWLRRLASHLRGEGRHNRKERSMALISSTHYTLDPRIDCSSLLKYRRHLRSCVVGLKLINGETGSGGRDSLLYVRFTL